MPGTTLLPWQAGLWMAGCLERLAPYVRAGGTPRAAAFYRDSVDAYWTGHGELAAPDAERIAAVGAKLSDLYEDSIEAQIFGVVVGAAEAARQPTALSMEQLVAWTVDLWSELGPEDEDWGEREAQAQRDTLAMTQQRPAEASAQLRMLSARLGAEWAAGLANHGLLNADPKRSQIVIPPPDLPYQVGDVVAVSCPWTPTVTTRRGKYHAAVRWPWAVLDPDSAYRPNGSFAFPVDESSEPWWPYQLRPPAAELDEGDRCVVGIPPMRCYVMRSDRYDPPRDDGFLPRGTASIALLPAGSGYAAAAHVWLERAEPIEMKLLHRPYGALRSGDVVDDANGHRLQFVPPFLFYADGRRVRPAWPLVLVTRDGVTPPPDAVDAVATATALGSHPDEIERWLTCSEVPYTAAVAEELFDET